MSYRDAVMGAKYAGGSNEQATALHQRRLEAVVEGAGYFDFDAPRGIVVHVVPTGVYDDGYAIDLGEHGVLPEANPSRPKQLPVLGRDGAHGSWTGDGFGAAVRDDGRCTGYAHLFSNGVVEAVSAIPFEGDTKSATDESPTLDGRTLELGLTRCVRRYLRVLSYHQRTAPVHVTLSAFGTEGVRLEAGGTADDSEAIGEYMIINEDILAPFPVTLENFDVDVREALADPIDALWRGTGRPASPFVSGDEWTLRSEFSRIK
ncbi:hypothetical protein [Haladaptatus sp. DYF46]|uniref:hypothetical protein n=1 Tax=Haladaptatus sp. DYF46 TaxID=2886041 RepID=UPI001E5D393C|nr:hypothetical protein [Haladaptatus sp. DYF46]